MTGTPAFQFDAFISYRRSDGKTAARWLRRELEGFRAPKALRDRFGRKLRVYLDTAYERGTIDFYEHSIKPALLASRYLLVVATPDAMRRPGGVEDWIQREVNDFAAGPNGGNIIAVRGAGEFDGPLPADLKERFPNIEIVDLRGASRFWFLNPIRAARLASEKLKIVAPLLDIPRDDMPRLRQEEERRQQVRLGGVSGATVGVLAAVTGLSVFALSSRNQALRALEDSMFAAGSMALEASRIDADDDATRRTRRLIINRGCDLVDKFREDAGSDAPIAEVVMCRLERAEQRERLSEHALARGHVDEAIPLAGARHQASGRIDAALALVRARQALGAYLLRQNDAPGAEAAFEGLLEDARRLGAAHVGRPDFAQAEADALAELGDIRTAANDHSLAADRYDAAAVAAARYIALRTSSGLAVAPHSVAWLVRIHRLAGLEHVSLGAADAAMERFRKSIAAADGLESPPAHVDRETALTQLYIFELERRRGNEDAAATARSEALASVARINAAAKVSAEVKADAAKVRAWFEERGEP